MVLPVAAWLRAPGVVWPRGVRSSDCFSASGCDSRGWGFWAAGGQRRPNIFLCDLGLDERIRGPACSIFAYFRKVLGIFKIRRLRYIYSLNFHNFRLPKELCPFRSACSFPPGPCVPKALAGGTPALGAYFPFRYKRVEKNRRSPQRAW